MSKAIRTLLFVTVVLSLLAACATPQVIEKEVVVEKPVVETVVVEKEVVVEKAVVETVEVQKEVVVTKETVVEVEKIVEVTPVPGRCAPMDAAEVDEIKIGATVPQSAPGAVRGGRGMMTAMNIAVQQLNAAGGVASWASQSG
jgi:hypothetical protein